MFNQKEQLAELQGDGVLDNIISTQFRHYFQDFSFKEDIWDIWGERSEQWSEQLNRQKSTSTVIQGASPLNLPLNTKYKCLTSVLKVVIFIRYNFQFTLSLTFHKVFKDPLKLSFENFLNGCPQGTRQEETKN